MLSSPHPPLTNFTSLCFLPSLPHSPQSCQGLSSTRIFFLAKYTPVLHTNQRVLLWPLHVHFAHTRFLLLLHSPVRSLLGIATKEGEWGERNFLKKSLCLRALGLCTFWHRGDLCSTRLLTMHTPFMSSFTAM